VNIKDLLIKHEGLGLKPYNDSVGIQTIGVGHNLERGISYNAAMFILDEDLANVRRDVHDFDWFHYLDPVRQDVILNMVFNLGISRFKLFTNTIKLIESGLYEEAAKEMLDSKWAAQVGKRAIELSEMMKTGAYQ